MSAAASGWRARLLSDTPSSRREAALGQAYRGWLQFRRNRLAVLGLAIVLTLVLLAAFAPLLATHDPYVQNLSQRLLAPGERGHWLGTDEFGRDVLSRLLYGARITLMIVVLVALIAAPIGLLVGTAAGYLGGVVDAVLMRITDIFLAFPRLILALAFVADQIGFQFNTHAISGSQIDGCQPREKGAAIHFRASTWRITESDAIGQISVKPNAKTMCQCFAFNLPVHFTTDAGRINSPVIQPAPFLRLAD